MGGSLFLGPVADSILFLLTALKAIVFHVAFLTAVVLLGTLWLGPQAWHLVPNRRQMAPERDQPADSRTPAPRFVEKSVPLSRSRLCAIYGLLALLAFAQLYDVVRDREHWPFSNYPMYSYPHPGYILTSLRLYGVSGDEDLSEVALVAYEYVQPLDPDRLSLSLERMDASPERVQLLTAALQDILARYERLRLAGQHNGPPLKTLRLYHCEWTLDPWARNVDHPDQRLLLFEFTPPSSGG